MGELPIPPVVGGQFPPLADKESAVILLFNPSNYPVADLIKRNGKYCLTRQGHYIIFKQIEIDGL